MGKTNYQSLKELTNELAEKLDLLANGGLQLNEIELLTDQAKELYERLVVIRYKAYEDRELPPTQTAEPVLEEEELETIESETPEEDMMMFDFSANDKEVIAEPEEAIVEDESEHVASVNDSHKEKDDEDDKSLNDNFKKEDGSFAKKFEKAAIADLKEHIGINRKFLYVNDLFNGDGNAYNAAIGELNSCASQEEAFSKINKLKTEQGWQADNATAVGFIELVERRYLG
ncbi:MAG: hypothetical protein AB8B72_09305 [Crocinitomicaceae bacterium]